MKKQATNTAERRRKTLIVGLGKTGLSCARYLSSRGVPLAVTDSRALPPALEQLRTEFPDAALFLGGFNADAFSAAERLLVSPGVSLNEPLIQQAMAQGVSVLGDIELFSQVVNAPYVAITGSNGKSTVTSLLGEMAAAQNLRVKVGGNIGQPALDLLDDETDLYVLELSSFQLETTHSLKPKAAAVLNLVPDHLDRYPDYRAYVEAKRKVYANAETGVFNRDDAGVMAMRGDSEKSLFFSLGQPNKNDFGLLSHQGQSWLALGDRPLLPVSELLIQGRHNQANALAALALGTALHFSMDGMLDSLKRYRGMPHRTQFVRERRGVRWYNDSKGTNPGACIAALQGLRSEGGDARILLIAGGEGKGADFTVLAPVVADAARCVILFGRDARVIEQALDQQVPVFQVQDLNAAVTLAAEKAQSGDSVLLSPACASFDMFRNYEQRGELFIDLVRRLEA
ncbi:MAG: UDP-N-acetylmuramoyl-L-alanine--D-glutamate ligase [Gammaproteobacteria bacterium]|nr:UDP-N-acetylmuramoyl-L-alanine--D-glutamate ligase [Gammaproteobacteria bacterium]HXK55877.1 UDP-N-acetylmuramoyl-L-alanine--D-glutamate ligase [Gammaproteobacteria bacterium]